MGDDEHAQTLSDLTPVWETSHLIPVNSKNKFPGLLKPIYQVTRLHTVTYVVFKPCGGGHPQVFPRRSQEKLTSNTQETILAEFHKRVLCLWQLLLNAVCSL